MRIVFTFFQCRHTFIEKVITYRWYYALTLETTCGTEACLNSRPASQQKQQQQQQQQKQQQQKQQKNVEKAHILRMVFVC